MTKATTAITMGAIALLFLACNDETSDGDEPDPVVCGSDTCTGGDICMVTAQEPECEIKDNELDPCPSDKPNDTQCGGAGTPCCCGDAPAPLTACDPATACGAEVTCDCLTDACPSGWMCSATAEPGKFTCSFAAP